MSFQDYYKANVKRHAYKKMCCHTRWYSYRTAKLKFPKKYLVQHVQHEIEQLLREATERNARNTLAFLCKVEGQSIMILQHVKACCGIYPRSTIQRFLVPEDKVSWEVAYKEYNPPKYTSESIYGKPWADPEIGEANFEPKWNKIYGNVNRKSHTGLYKVLNGHPINPVGRTGIIGRGVLGRWGPNHAADPIVTRWKTQDGCIKEMDKTNHKPILQFIAIKRRDTGEWALPGGMVDPGEKVAVTAVREFQEEAMNSLTASEEEKAEWKQKFDNFFKGGVEVYSGYVDDPRNTDNAWMETVAYNFHDDDGSVVGAMKLNAGDDAVGVRWVDVTPDIKLYASHKDIVSVIYKRLLKE